MIIIFRNPVTFLRCSPPNAAKFHMRLDIEAGTHSLLPYGHQGKCYLRDLRTETTHFQAAPAAAWPWESRKRELYRSNVQKENGKSMRDASGRSGGEARLDEERWRGAEERTKVKRSERGKEGTEQWRYAWGNVAWERLCQFASRVWIDY